MRTPLLVAAALAAGAWSVGSVGAEQTTTQGGTAQSLTGQGVEGGQGTQQ